jgi:hypothetical protein
MMGILQEKIAPGDAYLSGPTHGQIQWLAFDREAVPVPHRPNNLLHLTTVLLEAEIEYILLEREQFERRPAVFDLYWDDTPAGLVAESLPVGWHLVQPAQHPCAPCLYQFDPAPYIPATSRQRVTYGKQAVLYGYSTDTAAEGEPIQIITHWRLLVDADINLHVFVHLLDENGALAAQHDGPLIDDPAWASDHIYPEETIVRLAHLLPALPAGEYQVHVGLYRWPAVERVSATAADGEAIGTYPILFPLSIDAE